MRLLIQNYTSLLSTEPMYLAKSLELVGQDVFLWQDPNMSTFDVFDSFTPDTYITHYRFLTNDAIKYLSQNKNIQCVLNISGIDNAGLDEIASVFKENNINCPFVFTNAHDVLPKPKSDHLKVESILPGLDIFLPGEPYPDYELDLGVIGLEINKEIEDYVSDRDTYHLLKLTSAPERDKNFDFPVNVISMRSLYSRYNEIMFATDMNVVLSQLFYDAVAHANKVTFKIHEEEQPLLDQFLATTFMEEETDDLSAALKAQIKSRHTCVSRAARLCKFLKDSDTKLKLEKLKGTL